MFDVLDFVGEMLEFVADQVLSLAYAQRHIMTQNDALTTEVTTLGANLADVSTRIDKEISDLAAAVAGSAPNPAVDAAITNLKAANLQLSAMSSALASDDAPIVTPPA